jgi:hypothetical protein
MSVCRAGPPWGGGQQYIPEVGGRTVDEWVVDQMLGSRIRSRTEAVQHVHILPPTSIDVVTISITNVLRPGPIVLAEADNAQITSREGLC